MGSEMCIRDSTKPYASEELYFWRFITEADLMTLVERALDLFLPPMLDRLSLESYLVLVQKDITTQLAHMPVILSTWYRGGSSPGGASGASYTTWQAELTDTIPARN